MRTSEILSKLEEIALAISPTSYQIDFASANTTDPINAYFFYSKAKAACWISRAITDIKSENIDPRGRFIRFHYILRSCASTPDRLLQEITEVVDFIDAVMARELVRASLKMPALFAWGLISVVQKILIKNQRFTYDSLGEFLVHASRCQKASWTDLRPLVHEVIRFLPDPEWSEKIARRAASPKSWDTNLTPMPRFDSWEYQELLRIGIRPLVDQFVPEITGLLIEEVSSLVELKFGHIAQAKAKGGDLSEIWCVRIDQAASDFLDSDEALVHTLTYACAKVFERFSHEPARLSELDAALRSAQWQVFQRIRFHCYSQFPRLTKNWIKAAILGFENYADDTYGHEFASMVRAGCEAWKDDLLSQTEQERTFDLILTGPDRERCNARLQRSANDEEYQRYQQHFRAKQLWPFEPILAGKYLNAYLAATAVVKGTLTTEDYYPYRSGGVMTGQTISPTPTNELESLADSALITFLNEWDDAHRDPNKWWVDIDHAGLANAFSEVIRKTPARFTVWNQEWAAIKRPIYLRHALEAATECIKSGTVEGLTGWFKLCRHVAASTNLPGISREQLSETSTTAPDWEQARKAVVDFVDKCVCEDSKVSLNSRKELGEILSTLCVGHDMWLESDTPIITPRDPLNDAINTTRGRALETLVSYAFWVRRQAPETKGLESLPEVRATLDLRLAGKPMLTKPEYAQLGRLFPSLHALDAEWAAAAVATIFPIKQTEAWECAFNAYIQFCRPQSSLFQLLRHCFVLSLERIRLRKDDDKNDFVDQLAQHLFIYYIWGEFPLSGEKSLLAVFYRSTGPKAWSRLFNHVGHLLKNTPSLEREIKLRCMAFFESRLAVGEKEELKEFTFWLRAECLDATWRLESFAKTLDVAKGPERMASLLVETLSEMLNDHVDLVVTCFAKLTEGAPEHGQFYVEKERALPILRAGLKSLNPEIVESAMKAQDNLLRAGLFEYLKAD